MPRQDIGQSTSMSPANCWPRSERPSGRYCWKRLPFGLRLSQDIFQARMDLNTRRSPRRGRHYRRCVRTRQGCAGAWRQPQTPDEKSQAVWTCLQLRKVRHTQEQNLLWEYILQGRDSPWSSQNTRHPEYASPREQRRPTEIPRHDDVSVDVYPKFQQRITTAEGAVENRRSICHVKRPHPLLQQPQKAGIINQIPQVLWPKGTDCAGGRQFHEGLGSSHHSGWVPSRLRIQVTWLHSKQLPKHWLWGAHGGLWDYTVPHVPLRETIQGDHGSQIAWYDCAEATSQSPSPPPPLPTSAAHATKDPGVWLCCGVPQREIHDPHRHPIQTSVPGRQDVPWPRPLCRWPRPLQGRDWLLSIRPHQLHIQETVPAAWSHQHWPPAEQPDGDHSAWMARQHQSTPRRRQTILVIQRRAHNRRWNHLQRTGSHCTRGSRMCWGNSINLTKASKRRDYWPKNAHTGQTSPETLSKQSGHAQLAKNLRAQTAMSLFFLMTFPTALGEN